MCPGNGFGIWFEVAVTILLFFYEYPITLTPLV